MPRHYQGLTREGIELLLREEKSKGKPPNLSGLDMAGLDLSGLDFTSAFRDESGFNAQILGADFRNTKLIGCCFSGTDLASANLRGTDLTRAELVKSNLYTSLLQHAKMSGADLRLANLVSAELHEVKLDGANVAGARFGWTSISGVDLSSTHGLGQVIHIHPSPIGSDTLRLTANGLSNEPESKKFQVMRFLGNSGIDDELLSVFRTWISNPIEFYSCFISFSSKNQSFTERLYTDLQNNNVRCWFAPEDLKIGDKIRDQIDESIRLRDKLLLVLSEHSIASEWVEHEVESALEEERQRGRMVLYPIRLDDAVMDSNKAWAALIRRTRHIGDFTHWKDYDSYQKAFDRLLRDLKAEEKKEPQTAEG